MVSGATFEGRVLIEGRAEGEAVVLEEPLSFWGGFDPESGDIIERRHPQFGARLAGRILVMPAGRGSSSSSSVLAEAIRAGKAPSGIVFGHADEIVVLGAIVARELYEIALPIVEVAAPEYARLATGMHIAIDGGRITIGA
jgi:predicted aconitase with swiveling domain